MRVQPASGFAGCGSAGLADVGSGAGGYPYLAIDLEKLQKNIADMAEFAARQGVKLRPHAKAHKIPQIAKMQLKAGAAGITVAKLEEAEVMFAEGIEDILVAYPLVGETKLNRARALLERGCKLTLLVDSPAGALGIMRWPGPEAWMCWSRWTPV